MKTTHAYFFIAAAGLLFGGPMACAKRLGGGDQCVPQTCEEIGANCGWLIDACGERLNCGVCLGGQACGVGAPNVCGLGTCTPQTCVSKLVDCGFTGDGCGDLIDCGTACDGIAQDPDGGTIPVGTGGTGTGTGGDGAGTGGVVVGTGGVENCDYGTTVVASPTQLGTASQSPVGGTTERYQTIDVTRAGKPYKLITNGWGPGFQSHNIGWNGTGMSATLVGNRGSSGQPAGYPSVFCGRYSVNPVIDAAGCGLPTSVNTSIQTGLKWRANGNTNNYNVAWDIWIGDGYNLQSYLMVWLHFPGGTATGNDRNERPAGQKVVTCATVAGVPGVWDIWAGTVGGKPIINYVRPEGMDFTELEFDVRDFYVDATTRPTPPPPNDTRWVQLVGSQINSVAVGFELWNSTNGTGPLQMDDFYVNVN